MTKTLSPAKELSADYETRKVFVSSFYSLLGALNGAVTPSDQVEEVCRGFLIF